MIRHAINIGRAVGHGLALAWRHKYTSGTILGLYGLYEGYNYIVHGQTLFGTVVETGLTLGFFGLLFALAGLAILAGYPSLRASDDNDLKL